MPNDLSVWSLVLDASPIVQVVVVILLMASVASWAIIFRKSQVIGRSRRQAEKFESEFWSGGDLATLYRNVETKGRAGKGVTTVTGLPLPAAEIEALAAQLKKRCGSGGTVRDGVIEIQGEHRDVIVAELVKLGWQAKKSGG